LGWAAFLFPVYHYVSQDSTGVVCFDYLGFGRKWIYSKKMRECLKLHSFDNGIFLAVCVYWVCKIFWKEICMEVLLTINDVAALTKIKVGTLRKFVAKRSIPYVKLGAGLRFRVSEIEKWIEGCCVRPEGYGTAGKEQGAEFVLIA
jgi:excisionase family DNA binding protein